VDTQISQSVTLIEDVGDLAKEHQLMEDTSIGVPREVDLPIEVDPVLHPGYRMQQQYTEDDVSMQGHRVRSDSSQRHAEIYS
jgi:hypothetical protein